MFFSRRVSALDLIHASCGARSTDKSQRISQCIVEGVGVIEKQDLINAIEKVSSAVPASRFILKGRWGFKRWCAIGPLPRLRVIESNWSGESLNDADFLDTSLDLFKGPVIEVVYVKGRKTYIVFRVHHAIMDGDATLDFIKSFFKVLRGEEVEQFRSVLIAEDIFLHDEKKHQKLKSVDVATPFGEVFLPELIDSRPLYCRITLRGDSPFILPKVMIAIAAIAKEKRKGLVRFFSPINLRRYISGEKSSANLVGIMPIDIEDGDDERALIKKLNLQTRESRFAPRVVRFLMSAIIWVPFFVLEMSARQSCKRSAPKAKYLYSGLVTTLGAVKLSDFSTKNYKAETIFGAPSNILKENPLVALICANENCIEVILASPNVEMWSHKLIDFGADLKSRLEAMD
jgi:hypothetical protein